MNKNAHIVSDFSLFYNTFHKFYLTQKRSHEIRYRYYHKVDISFYRRILKYTENNLAMYLQTLIFKKAIYNFLRQHFTIYANWHWKLSFQFLTFFPFNLIEICHSEYSWIDNIVKKKFKCVHFFLYSVTFFYVLPYDIISLKQLFCI